MWEGGQRRERDPGRDSGRGLGDSDSDSDRDSGRDSALALVCVQEVGMPDNINSDWRQAWVCA